MYMFVHFLEIKYQSINQKMIINIGSADVWLPSATETKMLSFWRNFHHWLHWKLSFWQLPVQPMMSISSKWRHIRFSGRDHFVYAPSQWQTTLHSNVVSHWLGTYTKLSLPSGTEPLFESKLSKVFCVIIVNYNSQWHLVFPLKLDITWASWPHKSMSTLLFCWQLVQASNKEKFCTARLL